MVGSGNGWFLDSRPEDKDGPYLMGQSFTQLVMVSIQDPESTFANEKLNSHANKPRSNTRVVSGRFW